MFLYLSYQAVHGALDRRPLEAPNYAIRQFPYIRDKNRTLLAGKEMIL